MTYSTRCDRCNHPHLVEVAAEIALDRGIQWACPLCAYVMKRSTEVMENRYASKNQKELAVAVFTLAFGVGIILLADKLQKAFK